MAGPDGNRLGPDLVAALDHALAVAWRDEGVRAVVLTGRGADFCAGPWSDLPPPGPEPVEPAPVIAALVDLCSALASAPKPVVCALHGRVNAGGLALALAAQGCVADTRATLHFPEPRLGRLPPGSGAVRLAWRVGAAEALRLLARQGPIPSPEALTLGLIDRTSDDALLPQALSLAMDLAMAPATAGDPPGLVDASGYRAAVAAARAALPGPLPPHRAHEALLVNVIEAAQLLPSDQALGFDLIHAQDAARAPVARALAHLARATRRALALPVMRDVSGGLPRSSPLAAALSPENAARLIPAVLRSGARVSLLAADRAALAGALESVAEAQLDRMRAGKLGQSDSEADWNRLTGQMQIDPGQPPAMALADPEHAAWLEAALPPGITLALWAPGAARQPDLAHPDRALLLVPAPSRAPRLCEIVMQATTPPEAVQRAVKLALRLKLTPIQTVGHAALPLLTAAAAQAARVLRGLGVTSATLRDTGLLSNGADLGEAAADAVALPFAPERLILLAVINAGANLLHAGVVLRPSDIDLAMVLGAGWPNWRGGPMAEGEAIGPMVLRHEMRAAATLDADLWAPSPLFDTLIRGGQRFEDLNTAATHRA
jgi:3-hydroxyacyl-CoA dehydrogenase